MTKNYPSTKQSAYKLIRYLPIRTILALFIAPGLSLIIGYLFLSAVGFYSVPWMQFPNLLFAVYILSVPFSVPCLLMLRAFRVTMADTYVTLGMAIGLLNYWIFNECYEAYECYNDGTMSLSQALHYIWQISVPPFAFMGTALWGLTGFIFWLIAIRRWPSFSGPSLQDKQG